MVSDLAVGVLVQRKGYWLEASSLLFLSLADIRKTPSDDSDCHQAQKVLKVRISA